MKKREPKYLKILQGMNCCYGSDDRNCADCPFDLYNERDFYGQGTSLCMEKLNEAAKKWTETMTMFTNCKDCCMYRDGWESDETLDFAMIGKQGWCAQWNTIMCPDEYCSRGAVRD
ncbi:MAG: hypothetical protein IJI07_01140 [Flexilinea sp.]|nr:hypothetical protein [Flexilinea sp.]